MNPVARRLLGSPAFIETPGVLRWGHKGRMRVDTRRGRWHDFESDESGGVVDLVSHCMNLLQSLIVTSARTSGSKQLAGGATIEQASTLMGVSIRHTWRILAAYRKDGAAALAHGHRGRRAPNTISGRPLCCIWRTHDTRERTTRI